MIEFIFAPKDKSMFASYDEFKPVVDTIVKEMIKKGLYENYSKSIGIFFPDDTANTVHLRFNGMIYKAEEDIHFLMREVDEFVDNMGLSGLIKLTGVKANPQNNDVVFETKKYAQGHSHSEMLLDFYGITDEEVPEEFKCSITHVVMDDPVYFKGFPETRYDKTQLRFWLFKNSQGFENPFTRTPVSFSDILPDNELKKEINNYKTEIIKKKQHEKHAKKNINELSEQVEKFSLSGNNNKPAVLTLNSPITTYGDQHKLVVERLKKILDPEGFKFIFDALNNKNYSQALRLACEIKNTEASCAIVNTMLTQGRNLPFHVNEMSNGVNSILIAAKNGNVQLVNLLVDHGGNKNSKDSLGKSADDIVREHIFKSLRA